MTSLRQAREDGARGLKMVAMLADRWGMEAGLGGTTLTARVRRP